MSTPVGSPPGPETYRVPSLGYRILAGALRLIPLAILLIGLPVAVLSYLSAHQISLPVSIVTVTTFGIAIVALSTARYISKPTSAYGPVSMATSAVTLAYLFTLWLEATYRIAVPNSAVTVSIGYGELIDLLLLIPALALIAGLITTVEDLRSPRERLPFDFPP